MKTQRLTKEGVPGLAPATVCHRLCESPEMWPLSARMLRILASIQGDPYRCSFFSLYLYSCVYIFIYICRDLSSLLFAGVFLLHLYLWLLLVFLHEFTSVFMLMFMCLCISLIIFIFMFLFICTFEFILSFTVIFMFMFIFMFVCTFTFTCMLVLKFIFGFMFMFVFIFACAFMFACMLILIFILVFMFVCICTHTCRHRCIGRSGNFLNGVAYRLRYICAQVIYIGENERARPPGICALPVFEAAKRVGLRLTSRAGTDSAKHGRSSMLLQEARELLSISPYSTTGAQCCRGYYGD